MDPANRVEALHEVALDIQGRGGYGDGKTWTAVLRYREVKSKILLVCQPLPIKSRENMPCIWQLSKMAGSPMQLF